MREYFDYWFEDNEEIVEVGGKFLYVVVVNSLHELKEYSSVYFRSTIDHGS